MHLQVIDAVGPQRVAMVSEAPGGGKSNTLLTLSALKTVEIANSFHRQFVVSHLLHDCSTQLVSFDPA
jgi:hypothetical protein